MESVLKKIGLRAWSAHPPFSAGSKARLAFSGFRLYHKVSIGLNMNCNAKEIIANSYGFRTGSCASVLEAYVFWLHKSIGNQASDWLT